MRMMRWLLGCLVVLLVAVLAAAWLVPPRLDADRFRGSLQKIASRLLQAPVRVEGPIHLRLLPEPVLVAGPFQVAAAGPRDARLTAQGLRLELALGPLLTGHVEARSLVLLRPDVSLPTPLDPRLLLARRPAWLAGVSARVEDGRIVAGNFALQDVNATLGVDALSGDLASSGSAAAFGNPWRFSVRLTRPGGDGAAGLDVALDGEGALGGTALTFSGQLAANGALQGHVNAHGPDLSLLLPVPALSFTADGRLSVASGLAAADDLQVSLGGSPGRGAVAFRYAPSPRLDLALTASRLDLDPWTAALARNTASSAALAGGVPLGIDLSTEAATLEGGTLRNLRAAFDIEPGGVHVRELRATLPGDAELHLTGTVASGALPHLDADASLAAPALRTTLAWLTPLLPQTPALPPGVLREGDLSAHVVAGPEGVTLSRLAGTLDGARISGAVGWRRGHDGEAAKLAGVVSLHHLDLDPWLALGQGGPDLDLDLDAATAMLHGVTLTPFRLDMARESGAITVRDFRTVAGGVGISAHFSLSAEDRLEDATLVLDAQHLASLVALPIPGMNWQWLQGTAFPQDRLHAEADASGTRQSLSVRLRADVGESHVELAPTLDLSSGQWSGTLSLRDPSARHFLEETRVLSGRAHWLGEGSLSLRATASGGSTELRLDQFDIAAGLLHGTGSGRLAWDGSPSLSGTLVADTLPLPPIARGAVDAALLGGAPSLEAHVHVRAQHVLVGGTEILAPAAGELVLNRDAARLNALSAGLAGGTLHGQATLQWAGEAPRLEVQASLQDAEIGGPLTGLPVDLVSGRLGMQAKLAAQGHSTAALLSTLQGSASGSVSAGTIRGVSLGSLPAGLPQTAIETALAGGSTSFGSAAFAATVAQGIVTVTQGDVQFPGGSISLGGSFDLGQDAADLLLDFRPSGADAPVIGLRLEGPIGHVQRIPQLAALAQWRAEGIQTGRTGSSNTDSAR